ncbi:MAG: (2Fe-2S)-binding protein [Oleiphilaceae bacterium]|nr:(2Fe-2S)-binding protein [Oleiphilaceae bacterium]
MVSTESWPSRYCHLLESAGLSKACLADNASPPEGDGAGMSLASCLEQPESLRGILQMTAGEPRDFRAIRIQASVLHQNLVLSIIAPLTIRLLLDGQSQAPEPGHIRLHCADGATGWTCAEAGPAIGVAPFTEAMAARAKDWYPVFRQEFGVSPGAYWSSVGLALCAPFSALYDKAPPDTLCREATEWLAQFDCDAKKFIDWIPAEFNQHRCAIPQRRGCCLKYKLPEGNYCGTCGIYRKERMN